MEYPEKPVVRFATPVSDQTGIIQGIVVINLHAEFFRAQIQQLALARGNTTYLFNLSGFYIARCVDSASQVPPFEMKPITELSSVFPKAVLQNIMQGKRHTEMTETKPDKFGLKVIKTSSLTEWVVALAYPQQQLFATYDSQSFYALWFDCVVYFNCPHSRFLYVALPTPALISKQKKWQKGIFPNGLKLIVRMKSLT
ncbi:MAG: hypothetical protein DRQ49_17780 [Gammaproteobacteria bacterium]|nr:MAG: hypothetical protein DRQ49_17780 [Gammaproteobacteria bacterium]RKZ75416.1 MAG: hypothetical protein DRQ57_07505 [Gammaproteobacteria bacterium]